MRSANKTPFRSCEPNDLVCRAGGGEIARYFGIYGSKGISKAVIIGGVPPFLLKAGDNPEGVDAGVFEGIQKAITADRYVFFSEFFKNFYNTDVLLGKRVSEKVIQASWNIAAGASSTRAGHVFLPGMKTSGRTWLAWMFRRW